MTRYQNGRPIYDHVPKREPERVFGSFPCGARILIVLNPDCYTFAVLDRGNGTPAFWSMTLSPLDHTPDGKMIGRRREDRIAAARAWAKSALAKIAEGA